MADDPRIKVLKHLFYLPIVEGQEPIFVEFDPDHPLAQVFIDLPDLIEQWKKERKETN